MFGNEPREFPIPADPAQISRALTALSYKENGRGRTSISTYIADGLVLTVTEPEVGQRARRRRADRGHTPTKWPVGDADEQRQRRDTIEAVTGQRVAAVIRGHDRDPAITIELFVLEAAA
jgi:hypothetical protein